MADLILNLVGKVTDVINTVTDNGKSGDTVDDVTKGDYTQAEWIHKAYKLDIQMFNLLFKIPDKVIIDFTSKLNDFVDIEDNLFFKLLNYDNDVTLTTTEYSYPQRYYALESGHIKLFIIALMFATSYSTIRSAVILKKIIMK